MIKNSSVTRQKQKSLRQLNLIYVFHDTVIGQVHAMDVLEDVIRSSGLKVQPKKPKAKSSPKTNRVVLAWAA